MAKSGFMGGGDTSGQSGGGKLFGGQGGQQPAPKPGPALFQRGVGGVLPERGSPEQMRIVQQLLQNASGAAQQSNSPLLAFLTPMLGGAVNARTSGMFREEEKKRQLAEEARKRALRGSRPRARKIRTDVNGIDRYVDTGEQVFPGVTKEDKFDAGRMRQTNEATGIIDGAIKDLTEFGAMSRGEALAEIARNPLYAPQLRILGMDANEILNPTPPSTPSMPSAPAMPGPSNGPQKGTVEDGHEFLGGDPSDPNNWRKVS